MTTINKIIFLSGLSMVVGFCGNKILTTLQSPPQRVPQPLAKDNAEIRLSMKADHEQSKITFVNNLMEAGRSGLQYFTQHYRSIKLSDQEFEGILAAALRQSKPINGEVISSLKALRPTRVRDQSLNILLQCATPFEIADIIKSIPLSSISPTNLTEAAALWAEVDPTEALNYFAKPKSLLLPQELQSHVLRAWIDRQPREAFEYASLGKLPAETIVQVAKWYLASPDSKLSKVGLDLSALKQTAPLSTDLLWVISKKLAENSDLASSKEWIDHLPSPYGRTLAANAFLTTLAESRPLEALRESSNLLEGTALVQTTCRIIRDEASKHPEETWDMVQKSMKPGYLGNEARTQAMSVFAQQMPNESWQRIVSIETPAERSRCLDAWVVGIRNRVGLGAANQESLAELLGHVKSTSNNVIYDELKQSAQRILSKEEFEQLKPVL